MTELSLKDVEEINKLILEHLQLVEFCKRLLVKGVSIYCQNQKTAIEQTLRRDYGVVL